MVDLKKHPLIVVSDDGCTTTTFAGLNNMIFGGTKLEDISIFSAAIGGAERAAELEFERRSKRRRVIMAIRDLEIEEFDLLENLVERIKQRDQKLWLDHGWFPPPVGLLPLPHRQEKTQQTQTKTPP